MYIGEGNCTSKRDAEHSAAQNAYEALIIDNMKPNFSEPSQSDLVVIDNDSTQHMPVEYSDIEQFIATMVGACDGRIRKVRPPDTRGKYKLEIGGNYRYCENINDHHKKNQVYLLVDPIKRVYYQKCYDPDCQGFQSAKHPIPTNLPSNNQQITNYTGKCSGERGLPSPYWRIKHCIQRYFYSVSINLRVFACFLGVQSW